MADDAAAARSDGRSLISARTIEVLGQSLALFVVLGPVTGAAMRWLAFSFDPSLRDPLRAAIAAPLQELIATSAGAVVPPILLALILFPIACDGHM